MGYLDGAGRGVEIFTDGRIRRADFLTDAIAQNDGLYRRAIDICLPIAEDSSRDLRAIYLGLAGPFPERALPEVHVVFGANNTGGTVGPGAQVIGLEVLCCENEIEADIRRHLRRLYAHEMVHVLQESCSRRAQDRLLTESINEGLADFISLLVTGDIPKVERHAWAKQNEAMIWEQFVADQREMNRLLADMRSPSDVPPEAHALFRRWHLNANNPPEGWPPELGYWMGRQIVEAFYEQPEDKRVALDYLLSDFDPQRVWRDSWIASRIGELRPEDCRGDRGKRRHPPPKQKIPTRWVSGRFLFRPLPMTAMLYLATARKVAVPRWIRMAYPNADRP